MYATQNTVRIVGIRDGIDRKVLCTQCTDITDYDRGFIWSDSYAGQIVPCTICGRDIWSGYHSNGPSIESIGIDHNAYPRSLKSKSAAELSWAIKDCKEALKANPDNPKAGYYMDEIHYCGMELQQRQAKGGE